MISFLFDIDPVFEQLTNTLAGVEQLVSNNAKTQIAQAVFTITSRQFVKDFRIASLGDPKKYFHMYEWEKNGNNDKKLFTVKRDRVINGDLRISLNFKRSTTPVPIPSKLKIPNAKTGKSVTKKTIFANKAEVMESGKPVTFTTKQYIVFISNKDNEMHFIPPKNLVRILNPGGRATTGAFDRFATKWYAEKVDSVIQSSGLVQNLGNAVAKSLNVKNGGIPQAREAIKTVTQKYSQGVIEV
jgi:hypothetical protein